MTTPNYEHKMKAKFAFRREVRPGYLPCVRWVAGLRGTCDGFTESCQDCWHVFDHARHWIAADGHRVLTAEVYASKETAPKVIADVQARADLVGGLTVRGVMNGGLWMPETDVLLIVVEPVLAVAS